MKTFFTIIVLHITVLTWCQDTYQIQGNIKDTSENPIKAFIKFKEGITSKTIVTDSLGQFKLTVKKGILNLRVESEGYEYFEYAYTIVKDTNVNIELKKNKEIYEIIISEDKRKAFIKNDRSILKLNIPQLNELPSLTGTTDLAKILQLTPGVQNSGDVNGYLYIRGGDAGHSIFKYNDVPVFGSTHLFGIFPFYNAFHIGELVYDKANMNSGNGNVLGASINAKTNFSKIDKLTLTANVGLLASQINLKFPYKNSFFSISYRKTYLDEFLKLTGVKNTVNYRFNDVNFTFSHNFSSKASFVLDVLSSNDKLVYDSEELFADIKIGWNNLIATSQFNFKKSENFTFQSRVYISSSESDMNVQQDNLSINVKASIIDLGLRNIFNYNIQKIKAESGILHNNYSISPYNLILNNFGFSPKRDYPTMYSNLFSIYQDFNFSLSEGLAFKSGFRFNYFNSSKHGTFSFEPKIGLYFNEKRTTNYYIAFAKKAQHLSLVTTSSIGIPTDFWISSQKDIPYQQSEEFSLGLSHKLNPAINCNADIFYNKMSNLVIYPFALSQFNETAGLKNDLFVGRGKAYGLEFLFKKDKGKLKGWLSYTWSKSLRSFPEINEGKYFYAKYDRRHNFSSTLTYDLTSKFTIGFTQILSSGSRYTSANQIYFINNIPIKEYNEYNNAQLPVYIRSDVSLNFWIFKIKNKESKIALSVYNLLNIKNPVYQSVNFKKNDDQLSIYKKDKVFYGILPSINWYFKF